MPLIRIAAAVAFSVITIGMSRADDSQRIKDMWAKAHKSFVEGRAKEAAAIYEEAIKLAEKAWGKSSLDTASLVENLGRAYLNAGQYSKIEPLYLRTLAIREANLPKDDLLIGRTAMNLANLYLDTRAFAKAEPHYLRTIAIREAKSGKDHPDTAQALMKLAECYRFQSQYAKAEPLYVRALAIQEAKLSKDHDDTCATVFGLARAQEGLTEFAKAEAGYIRVQSAYERKYGKDDPLTGDAHESLGIFYKAGGQYARAEPHFLRVLAIREKTNGKDHANTASALTNLGTTYRRLGQYAKAEAHYQRSLAILKQKPPADPLPLAVLLNDMGNFQYSLGQFDQAEKSLLQAIELYEKKFGKEDTLVANSLSNLANVYQRQHRYDRAVPLYERALAIREGKLGKHHPDLALTLGGLANTYSHMQQHDKAETTYLRTIAIEEAKFGKDHHFVGLTLNNLALLYRKTGALAKAEPCWQRAIEIARVRLPKDHPYTSGYVINQAGLQVAMGRLDEAMRGFDRGMRSLRTHSAEVLPILGDAEQLAFLKHEHVLWMERTLSLGLHPDLDNEQRLRVASWLLNSKSIAAESLMEQGLLARDADTPEARAAIVELNALRQRIAQMTIGTAMPPALSIVETLKERERRLAATLATTGRPARRDNPWIELDEVRQKLPENAAFIDIARFLAFDHKTDKHTVERYIAYLSFRSGETCIVDLGNADPIDAAVKAVRKELEASANTIREKGEPAAEATLKESLTALGKLVLDPLMKHVGSKERWVLSPDSQLWLVPWGVLPVNGNYAAEKHTIQYVVSGRDLVMNAARLQRKTTTPVVMADPDFDMFSKTIVIRLNNDGERQRGLSKDFKLGSVRRLAGTALEAEAILPKLREYAEMEARVLTNQQAVTSAFRSLKSPRVLDMSTHGFFLEAEANGSGENPLLRCGLLLAGCNNAAKASPGADTGVLTGFEIVGTDLRGTELVVLSACETGLGDVRNGDGVVGLRQAFQLAGAQSVVATLWQVPDRDSALLMASFFDKLAAKQARDVALAEAQREMIKNRRVRFGAAHPYFWAAYTLTGQAK